jgi:nucleotide-binding universal stress UspA family protein
MEENAMKRILVPVDGSQRSLAAVRAAVREGPSAVERIDVINVQPLLNRHISRWIPRSQRDAWRAERGGAALATARALLESSGLPWRAHTAAGPTATVIANAARELRSDEIVIGAARRGPFARALANSLSARLLETSGVPVRVIPAAEAPVFERLALPAGLGLVALLFFAGD